MTAGRLEELAQRCDAALAPEAPDIASVLELQDIADLARCAREYGQQIWRMQGPRWMKCPTCKKNGFRRKDVWEPFSKTATCKCQKCGSWATVAQWTALEAVEAAEIMGRRGYPPRHRAKKGKNHMKTLKLTAAESRAYAAGERCFWRAMRKQPDRIMESLPPQPYWNIGGFRLRSTATNPLRCPYGTPGDRIRLEIRDFHPQPLPSHPYAFALATITAISVTERDGKWGWMLEVGA